MATINFPDSPTVGDVYTVGSSSYTWNGTAWLASSIATIDIEDVSGLQTALDAKATIAYVDAEIAGLIDAAPVALDTLNELAAALGDDANYAATVTTALSTKQANVITAQGDLVIGNSSSQPARLAVGTSGQVLTSNGTTASWQSPAPAGIGLETVLLFGGI